MPTPLKPTAANYLFRLYEEDQLNRDALTLHYRKADPSVDFSTVLRKLMRDEVERIRQ